jgi:Na+-translocating ferredoxin:NAD+ oxidoreductase RNF subunit RnfB
MDWSLIWKASLGLAGFGIALGAILAIASKRFHVEVDPRVEEVLAALPGSNCGACGLAGCEAAAEAVVQGTATVKVCKAGGPDVAVRVGEIMGLNMGEAVPVKAHIHCRGGKSFSPLRAIYEGVSSCRAAQIANGGGKACPFGCLGLQDCMEVCPANAIAFDEEGIRHVNVKKCNGCGLCAETCPRGLIEMVPAAASVFVRCKSAYTGKKATNLCKVACTGCRKCEKACKQDAIHVAGGFATIDYDKCTGCGDCALACPTGAIQIWVPDRAHPEGGEFIVPAKQTGDDQRSEVSNALPSS